MHVPPDSHPPSLSEEMLQSNLVNAMLTWRAELEEALPSFVWETAARERSRSDISEKDDRMSKLGTVRYFCRHMQIISPS